MTGLIADITIDAPQFELRLGPLGALLDRFAARLELRKNVSGRLAHPKQHIETAASVTLNGPVEVG
jgi:hypothetical protein